MHPQQPTNMTSDPNHAERFSPNVVWDKYFMNAHERVLEAMRSDPKFMEVFRGSFAEWRAENRKLSEKEALERSIDSCKSGSWEASQKLVQIFREIAVASRVIEPLRAANFDRKRDDSGMGEPPISLSFGDVEELSNAIISITDSDCSGIDLEQICEQVGQLFVDGDHDAVRALLK